MHYRDVARALGFYLWILLIPLAIPTGIAIYTDWIAEASAFPQPHSAFAFLLTMTITALLGLIFWFCGLRSHHHLFRREGLLLVLIVYFLTPAIGALPFWLNGTLSNPVDAYFEAVSGFTTTGASVMEAKQYNPLTGEEVPIETSFCIDRDVEYEYYGTITPILAADGEPLYTGIAAVSKALIFWRSFMQCLGGGGIVVLFVAILPALGVGGKILYQTEVTGPSKESIFPRVKETASMLWKVYLGLIFAETILLYLTNERMPLFDALNISFSTLSTGGFAPTSGSIATYQSLLTNWIVILFMIMGSVNFTLYFLCMRGKFSKLNDPELKAFLSIILVTVLLIAWQLFGVMRDAISNTDGTFFSLWEGISYGAFMAVSAQTSTGFVVSNFDVWPFSTQVLLLILFFVGGMAGSTAGGIKIVRQQTFFRILLNKIETIFRPDTVREYRLGSSIISTRTAMTVLCFFLIVGSLTILSTYLFVVDGIDPETSLTTAGCMINNVGIAFRAAGPTHSFAFLPPLSKLWSIFMMIAGRLEFFALLIAFVPAFWRRS
ncbi:MAG: Trk system potassium uptake protein TrkG [Chlamydiales bacterium]|nr:Trk system potassium uptake protein TrkG [Chlamydiales bacterium]MCH9635007.1 Trk system potassium uptake protein TrkG [Chlamydiales bacterium]MCH9703725.1 TrkH family potassium uptake protein [Chlamydiota bacterium]